MAGWEYWFQGQSYGNSAKDFVNTIFDNYPSIKEMYKDAPEFKRNNVENKVLWFTFAHKLKRHHLEGRLDIDWDIDIMPIDDGDEEGSEDDVGKDPFADDGDRGVEGVKARKVRRNQGKFRKKMLEAYDGKCCMTGIDVNALLVASHIKPWSQSSEKDKMTATNGLLLNALHDHAFDRGLITISNDDKVLISTRVSKAGHDALEGMLLDKIKLPEKVKGNREFRSFLEWHRENVFDVFKE